MRCEDYPCCGHGPAPLGDGGGCPDERGRFRCIGCGNRYDVQKSGSSYCADCLEDPRTFHDPECPGCGTCEGAGAEFAEFACPHCGDPLDDPDAAYCEECAE